MGGREDVHKSRSSASNAPGGKLAWTSERMASSEIHVVLDLAGSFESMNHSMILIRKHVGPQVLRYPLAGFFSLAVLLCFDVRMQL